MGVIIRPPPDSWEALTPGSQPSSHLLGTEQVLVLLSLSPLTDGKTEAQGGAPAGSAGPGGGPFTAGSAQPPPSSSPLPLAAEGREAGRGQGRCTWCPRGEVTGGAPEVGLGDPGPGVPAPASWLWRGRKLGRFSGVPRPAAPPRFLPAPRARPAPPPPSPSRRQPRPSFPRSAWDPPDLCRLSPPARPRGAGFTFLIYVWRRPSPPWRGGGPCVRLSPRSSRPCFPSLCVSWSSSLFFLPLCVSVRVPLFVSVSLFPLRSFPPAPRPLLLPVVFSTLCHFLPQSLLSPSLGLDLSASPSVISPTVAYPRVSRVSLSMSIFLWTLLSFPSLPAVSLSLSDALSPQCLSVHLLCLSIIILVSISLPYLAQKLYLCPSLSTASGFPHHPQFRATNSPNPTSTSPLPENRCGHGQNLVPVSPDSPLCLWDLNTHK